MYRVKSDNELVWIVDEDGNVAVPGSPWNKRFLEYAMIECFRLNRDKRQLIQRFHSERNAYLESNDEQAFIEAAQAAGWIC